MRIADHPLCAALVTLVLVGSTPEPGWARGGGPGGGGFSGGGSHRSAGVGRPGGGFAGPSRGLGHGAYAGGGSHVIRPVSGSHGLAAGYPGHTRGRPGYRTWGPGHDWGYHGAGYSRGGYWGYPGYYGWGLGLGLGVGYGIGYGLSGGYGYYGYPVGGYYGYCGYPVYSYTTYANTYYVNDSPASGTAAPSNVGSANSGTTAPPPPPAARFEPRAPNSDAQAFVDRAETAFHNGEYAVAVQAFRHAAVDDPQNALITLLLGQALFATGQFDEAAGATQAALRQLAREQWGVTVTHYAELYGKPADYTDQLHSLESAIRKHPDDPALRFLAGYHYAYLGFTTEAIDQLNVALKLAPRDEISRQLRQDLQKKHDQPAPPAPLVPGLPAEPKDE
ncbi:MAG: tetratricopeptide repeat protein [Planctomycetes bacterium]|nr:tetratricopeptide repeat protein [Planctomycetota bacterium]